LAAHLWVGAWVLAAFMQPTSTNAAANTTAEIESNFFIRILLLMDGRDNLAANINENIVAIVTEKAALFRNYDNAKGL
jgi:hypothetical protein